MLSLGTEVFLAFWMASYSVGLPAGSPPPVRADTSMFLISLAKFLPRRASMIAFLCLVVAHLEWPLMRVLPLSLLLPADEVRSTSLRGRLCPTAPRRAAQRISPSRWCCRYRLRAVNGCSATARRLYPEHI